MIRRFVVIAAALLAFGLGPYPAAASDWLRHAERLTGESEAVRANAIRRLKRIKGLDGELTLALTGPDKFLAVDVIATLKLKDFLPLLVELSKIDELGVFYLAINTLMDDKNGPDLLGMYQARLAAGELSVPAALVVLDTLGRVGAVIPVDVLERYAEDDSAEVRSAALYYSRLMIRRGSESGGPDLVVKQALRDPAYQLRLQALHTIQDLPATARVRFKPALAGCRRDRHEEVRKLCETLSESLG